jgi:hypothetical protein
MSEKEEAGTSNEEEEEEKEIGMQNWAKYRS